MHLERLVKHKGQETQFFTENVLAKARVERWQQETLRLAGSICVAESIRCGLMAEVSGVGIGQKSVTTRLDMEVELTWSSMDTEAKGAGEGESPGFWFSPQDHRKWEEGRSRWS